MDRQLSSAALPDASDPRPTAPPPEPATQRRVRRRLPPTLRRLVRMLVFLLVVHYLLLPQLSVARKSLTVIAHLNPLLLLAGVAAESASCLDATCRGGLHHRGRAIAERGAQRAPDR